MHREPQSSVLTPAQDKEFEDAGARLVDEGSWPNVPKDHIIIGLKELEDKDPFPLVHEHITFAHCYKGQGGWQKVLGRWPRGGGILYDLEFLEHEVNGRKIRVAAFGYHAGYAGAALALKLWAWQLSHSEPFPAQKPYPFQTNLDEEVKRQVAEGVEKNGGQYPTVFVMGALGRCGSGAVGLCEAVGIPSKNVKKWDLAETKDNPGPYPLIRDSDVFVNCIYLSAEIPPFISADFLKEGKRDLSVICDVSADTTNPHNPIPICNEATYFDKPSITVPKFYDPPLSYITIDHLPSLLPREASEAFSNQLLPHLRELPERKTNPVWAGAKQLFDKKVATLPDDLPKKEKK